MYYIQKSFEISASHHLTLTYSSKCTQPHGHNWHVTVYCKARELNENGMVADFGQIKQLIHGRLDHQDINKVLPCDILDNGKFMTEVEQFVNIGEFWNNVVRGYAEAADQESPGEDAAADAASFSAANFMPV